MPVSLGSTDHLKTYTLIEFLCDHIIVIKMEKKEIRNPMAAVQSNRFEIYSCFSHAVW
jgi:hypothetical protein